MIHNNKILNGRVADLRGRMRKWGVSALLVTNPRDIRYLTGFIGDDSWAVVPRSGRVHILSDTRFEEQIQREAPQARAHMRKLSLGDTLAEIAGKARLRKIGVQADYVSLGQHKTLAKKVGAGRLVTVEDGLIKQRAVKDAGEVAAIRGAVKIQEEAYKRTLRHLKPGQSEEEIAAYLEYQMRLLGADGVSFPSIIAADANSSLPHAIPGKRKVKRGGIVLFDWGARYKGYCSDMTRVVAIGKMPAKIREIYKIVLDAHEAAVDLIGPGVSVKKVDAAARDLITKAGYGKRFGHGLGHGIGLDIHEQPVLSYRFDGALKEGEVVTVEPGIYLPGVGGVRIEDDVLVTGTGRRLLNDLPKDLESAII